jgi:Ni,Fe-hydrogenase III large subunit
MDEYSHQIDWTRIVPVKRVWLGDAGGDQDARLEFLAEHGLRLVMADINMEGEETLHFFNPRDEETIHLTAGGGKRLLDESSKYFPEARRWRELLEGGRMKDSDYGPGAVLQARDGLLLQLSGGRVQKVYEAAREYPQAAMYGKRAREAGFLLEKSGGLEGVARGIAFIQALEEARGVKVPEAALALRAALLEITRIFYHLMWMSRASTLLRRQTIAEKCASLRIHLGRRMLDWLGEPQGRGWIVPGGIKEDFPLQGIPETADMLASAVDLWEELQPAVLKLPVPGWAARRLKPIVEDAHSQGWVGPLARAVGLDRDTRIEEPGVYAAVGWKTEGPPEKEGLLRRMIGVRAYEIGSALAVARRILTDLPGGKLLVKRGRGGKGLGFGRCEGPDGEVSCHLSTGKGRVAGMTLSVPHELNRSAARSLEGAWLDEVEVLSLLWEAPAGPRKG